MVSIIYLTVAQSAEFLCHTTQFPNCILMFLRWLCNRSLKNKCVANILENRHKNNWNVPGQPNFPGTQMKFNWLLMGTNLVLDSEECFKTKPNYAKVQFGANMQTRLMSSKVFLHLSTNLDCGVLHQEKRYMSVLEHRQPI